MYLNCHSNFSLNYGIYSPEKLVEEAKARGVKRMALTDINSTAGVVDFVNSCYKYGIRPAVGMEIRNRMELCYIALAHNEDGFENLNRWASGYFRSKGSFPPEAPELGDVFWIYPLSRLPKRPPKQNEWLGIQNKDLNQWQMIPVLDKPDFPKSLYTSWEPKTLGWQPVTFLSATDKTEYKLHCLLRCIEENVLATKLLPSQRALQDECFATPVEIASAFSTAHKHLLTRADALLMSCCFERYDKSPKNKKTFSDDKDSDFGLLSEKTWIGFEKRYSGHGKKDYWQAKARVGKELELIKSQAFEAYYLITLDIIEFGKSQGFFHIGRGSGANSIVAYCLGITDVDPIELDLYFERFINEHRSSPPDFDIDFSWDERRTIQEYIFNTYGEEHVAMQGTHVDYKQDSTIRELGKVLGLPKFEIDAMVENPDKFKDTKAMQLIAKYTELIRHFKIPHYFSVHASGILISERSIYRYTALHYPPLGFPVTQFDMYGSEAVGFAKFDILSQRGLGHIKEAVDIVRQNRGEEIDVHAIQTFKQDPVIRNQIESSETIGCFYIESPAMRQLLSKLRCNNYLTLVAASSIIRPGVAQSGMMKAYIQRFHNPNSFEYIHPIMKELMEETFGIMIYQEDVIKVAHHFAGLSLADADVLRRTMSGKGREKRGFDQIQGTYFKNCKERGYSDYVTNEVWRQIESFGGYSFSKGHSASYAVESYQSLYLKTNYPLEFMVAVINNSGGFYRPEVYIHEARRSGAKMEAPCVNNSFNLTSIQKDTIYLGFRHLKSLETKVVERLVKERTENGPFKSFGQLARRVAMGLEQMVILIRIGALRFTGQSKKELLWEAHILFHTKEVRNTVMHLFDPEADEVFALPEFAPDGWIENAYDETELLGFPLCSPFDLVDWRKEAQRMNSQLVLPEPVDTGFEIEGWKPAQQALKMRPEVTRDPFGYAVLEKSPSVSQMKTTRGQYLTMYGYLIATKNIRTRNGQDMCFGCFIDQEGHFLDTVHFSESMTKYPFFGRGVYRLHGKVVDEFGFTSLEVREMEKLGLKKDPRKG